MMVFVNLKFKKKHLYRCMKSREQCKRSKSLHSDKNVENAVLKCSVLICCPQAE